MQKLLHNIRFYVLCFTILFSLCIFLIITNVYSSTRIQIIRLEQMYALVSLIYLYLALLAGPACYTFKFLPFRAKYLKARRAIGVSSFYFALLHVLLSFFGQLGGFAGLTFLNEKYLLAIILGFVALLVLFFMAITSIDRMVEIMTFRYWKMLHRFVYLAGIFILIHTVMLGTHFNSLSGTIPFLLFIALTMLLMLEARRIDALLTKYMPLRVTFGPASLCIALALTVFFLRYMTSTPEDTKSPSFGIHTQHINQVRSGQQNSENGLTNTQTKRFTVDVNYDTTITPKRETKLSFKMYHANSGNPVILFDSLYEKKMHLIIVSDDLTFYNHVHPEQTGDNFYVNTIFPQDGRYHLYLDFQPKGADEQQYAFTIPVGSTNNHSTHTPDKQLIKTFGKYEISLDFNQPLKASELSLGEKKLTFTVKNAQTKQAIKSLHPYLGAYGHLVMINQKTYEYLHVHPVTGTAPRPTDRGGPYVSFIPLGLYGPIQPGIYRVFAQFNPDGSLLVADFTITIQ